MFTGQREIADGTTKNGTNGEGEEVARFEEVRKEGAFRVAAVKL